MFERRTRPAFPARNIILLCAVVLGALVYMLNKVKETPRQNAAVEEQEAGEKRDSGLFPFEMFYAIREYPDFKADIPTFVDALTEAHSAELVARPRGNNGISAPWTLQGPANIGARVNTIAIHPQNHDIVYLGFSCGGVWKTTNGGQSWKPVFDDQNFLSIGHVAINPANPEEVYIGTGDPNISGYPFIGDGVWKSTNGGQTWEYFGLESQRIVSKIIPNPSASGKIYAATMGLPFERNNDRGLYTSTANSGNWERKLFVSNQAGIIDMVVDPTNSNIVYAAGWDRIRNNQESLVTGENARIWKSTDGGANWTKLENGLPLGNQCRIGLAIDPSNSQHIIASYCGENLEFSGLFETFNGGSSWNENPCSGLEFDFQSNFAWYFGQVRINPYNPSDIWLLGVQSFRSLDGGQSWYLAAGFDQDVHADHHDIAFFSATDLLLGTDGGSYRSVDNGETWFRYDNVPTTQFYRVAYNPHTPDYYYGGAQDNGTVAGNAQELESWSHLFGGDGFQAVFHPTNPDIYYFEYQNGVIYGTVDGFFDRATEGIEDADRRSWDMQYIMSKHDPDVMYTGTYRLYMGLGHLPFWSPVTDDLTDGIIFGPRYHTISTLDESPIDPEQVYVGTTDGNVWRYNPTSFESTAIYDGLPDRYVSSVKASPNNPDRVFVSHTGYRANDFTPRIYRSDNKGATWTPIAGNLPNLAINDIHVLPGHQDSVIFAATDGGVYATLNGGVHWDRLGSGMPYVPVYDLDINLSQKTLIAGTFARSIMTFPLDSLRIGENSSTFSPGGIAPPSLTVTPTLTSDHATVTVENLKSNQSAEVFITDMSGKTVYRQYYKGFGKHSEPLDIESYAPGIYIVFARSNGKVWGTRKFVVAR